MTFSIIVTPYLPNECSTVYSQRMHCIKQKLTYLFEPQVQHNVPLHHGFLPHYPHLKLVLCCYLSSAKYNILVLP